MTRGAVRPGKRKRKRLSLEIMADILETASDEGLTVTALAYRTNLNFLRGMRHVKFLLDDGLLERVGSSPSVYKTTARGKEAAQILRGVSKIIMKRADAIHDLESEEVPPFERRGLHMEIPA